MSIRINTKPLGLKKPIFVEQSVKNVKLANEMMNKMLKLGIEPVSYTHLTLPTICSV